MGLNKAVRSGQVSIESPLYVGIIGVLESRKCILKATSA
jgi:hypothetical protein